MARANRILIDAGLIVMFAAVLFAPLSIDAAVKYYSFRRPAEYRDMVVAGAAWIIYAEVAAIEKSAESTTVTYRTLEVLKGRWLKEEFRQVFKTKRRDETVPRPTDEIFRGFPGYLVGERVVLSDPAPLTEDTLPHISGMRLTSLADLEVMRYLVRSSSTFEAVLQLRERQGAGGDCVIFDFILINPGSKARRVLKPSALMKDYAFTGVLIDSDGREKSGFIISPQSRRGSAATLRHEDIVLLAPGDSVKTSLGLIVGNPTAACDDHGEVPGTWHLARYERLAEGTYGLYMAYDNHDPKTVVIGSDGKKTENVRGIGVLITNVVDFQVGGKLRQ